jgi:hypothetical protein
VYVRRLIRSALLSSCLLAFTAAGPALADSTFSDSAGTSVTLQGDGTISFTCKGLPQVGSGKENYLVCVDGSSTSLFSTGTVTPASATVGFNQTITASVTSTVFGGKLGVATFLTWTGGTCTFDVTQKIFNRSGDIVRITQYKRIANVDVDGSTSNTFVGGSTSLTVLAGGPTHTVILSGGGNTGATNALAYSAPVTAGEPGTCGQSQNASRLSVTGDRVLAVRYNFQPGYVGLKPTGQSGSEKFFSVRYSVQ